MGLGTNRKNQNDWLPSKLDIESALLMAAENNTSGSSNNYPIIDCIGKTSLVINDNDSDNVSGGNDDNNGDSMSNNARGTNTNYEKNSMSSSFSSSSSSLPQLTLISTFLLINFSISVIITTTVTV